MTGSGSPPMFPTRAKPACGSGSLHASALRSQPRVSLAAVPALSNAAFHHLEQRLRVATIKKSTLKARGGAGSKRTEAPDAVTSGSGNSHDTESEGAGGGRFTPQHSLRVPVCLQPHPTARGSQRGKQSAAQHPCQQP